MISYLSSTWLRKLAHFSQHLVQFSLTGKLEYQEDTFCVMEMTKKSQNIRMSQIRLYLNLSSQLLLNLPMLKFTLV